MIIFENFAFMAIELSSKMITKCRLLCAWKGIIKKARILPRKIQCKQGIYDFISSINQNNWENLQLVNTSMFH